MAENNKNALTELSEKLAMYADFHKEEDKANKGILTKASRIIAELAKVRIVKGEPLSADIDMAFGESKAIAEGDDKQGNVFEGIVRAFDDAVKKYRKAANGKVDIQPLRFYFTKREIEIYHKAVPDRMKNVKGKWYLDGVEVVTIGKLKTVPTKRKGTKK